MDHHGAASAPAGQGDASAMRPAGGRRDSRQSRRDSISSSMSRMSRASFIREVEMATTEMFSGPVSDTQHSSAGSFSHRRPRASTSGSFHYFHVNDSFTNQRWDHETNAHAVESDDESTYGDDNLDDLETSGRRKNIHIRDTIEDPLLERTDSRMTTGSRYKDSGRDTQEFYIETEDLRIVVGGFKNRAIGQVVYWLLAIGTLGLAALALRWFPRWRIWLLGKPTPFADADWLVVENQWGELSLHDLKAVSYGRPLSSVFGVPEKMSPSDMDEDNDPMLPELRFFDYRYIRFCYHPVHDQLELNNSWKDPAWTSVKALHEGVDGDEVDPRRLAFGDNVIDIEEKSSMQLLIDEVFHPFYVFQIFSLILWSIEQYYYYAVCIFAISAFSIVTTLIETKQTMKRLREISRFVVSVRVLRNGFWRHVESNELVPGDVFEISDPSIQLFPCDCLLLSGDAIVNESMLTGESVPVSKIPATDTAIELLDLSATTVAPELAKSFLFSGTKVVRVRKPQDGEDEESVAVAMVVRTGFNTTKGALVRSMLFPKPSGFKFYRDSFYYIGVMGAIAGLGFIASIVTFIRLGLSWQKMLVRALDLITIVVPPALPATLTIGTSFALGRLKSKQIFCISPQRINIGGKLDVVCFDKTGTLTEDGLDVLGVRVVEGDDARVFGDLCSNITDLLPRGEDGEQSQSTKNRLALLHTMATCHSLRVIEDELLGDPLDQKMFAFTEWKYSEGERKKRESTENPTTFQDDSPRTNLTPPVAWPPASHLPKDSAIEHEDDETTKLGVHRQFEFVSQLRRASVIVKHFGAAGGHVYVKGAPECMQDICNPNSFPEDYEELLAHYTHSGYRVIACATKYYPKLSWIKTQKMKRAEAESNLDFLGFIIFENKLKPQTTGVIVELERAGIRRVMCTGDNILTAISVGRECRLIDKSAHIFVPRFVEGDCFTSSAKLEWESVDNPAYKLDEKTLAVIPPSPSDEYYEEFTQESIENIRNHSLAVPGDAFRWIVDYAPAQVLNGMLTRGQIFARMSPDEKHELVERLQTIDYCVGFCGDGANDCGALKAADVGISLSEAEASVAAPFTSRVFDISCVPQVIREGRASLVTSFSCFKYMSLYSAIQFITVSILYKWASNLGDFQFLYIDMFLILPIAIFMGWSEPCATLCRKRPTARLISRKVLTPLLGQIAIAFVSQFTLYKAAEKQPWYIPPTVAHDDHDIRNSANTVLFLLSCFQYIGAGIVLNKGMPYRRPWMLNVPFVVSIIVTTLASLTLLLGPYDWIYDTMELTDMAVSFRIVIMLSALAYFVVSLVGENWVFVKLADLVGWLRVKVGGYVKKRKMYKELLAEEEKRGEV